jgi:hypothetical protein
MTFNSGGSSGVLPHHPGVRTDRGRIGAQRMVIIAQTEIAQEEVLRWSKRASTLRHVEYDRCATD